MTDEHFITWMRTAGLPDIRKIYGKVENLEPGNYSIKVNNKFDVKDFKGKKSFVVSSTNLTGGQNYFLAVSYIVMGTFCMIMAFVFLLADLNKRFNQN